MRNLLRIVLIFLLAGIAVAQDRPPQRIRVSQGVSQGMLLHQVTPQYPPLAQRAGIQGTVILAATIGKDGTIQELKLVSGHPMLVASAIDAVKQWRYQPYRLQGKLVEVETQITVNYLLSGSAPVTKLTFNDVKELLEGEVAPKRVATLCKQYGVDFDLGGDRYAALKKAGATDEVFDAITASK